MADNFLTLIDKNAEDIKKRVPEYIDPERFILLAKNYNRAIQMSSELRQCKDDALFQCVLDAADRGLEVGGPSKHAAIVPFKTKNGNYFPVLIVQWQGEAFLWSRAGAITKLRAGVAYNWDEFEWDAGSETLHHKQDLEATHSAQELNNINNIKAAYAVATLPSGEKQYSIVTRSQLMRTMEAVKRRNGSLGFGWTDWLPEMCRKTAVHRLGGFIQPPPKMSKPMTQAWEAARQEPEYEDAAFERVKEAEQANKDIDNPPPREAKIEIVPDKKKSDADENITGDEESVLLARWRQAGKRIADLGGFLSEKFGCDDLSGLKKGQIAEFMAAL